MDDARLSGDVTGTDNADRYCAGVCGPDTFRADILWGTIEITNDGGTWVGTNVGTTDKTAHPSASRTTSWAGPAPTRACRPSCSRRTCPRCRPDLERRHLPGELSPDR